MVLIGLGNPAQAILDTFSDDHNKTIIVDSDFTECETIEDYENKCPDFDLSFEEEECWFVVCGGSKCAAAALKILQPIKEKKINVLYICPDPDLSGPDVLKRHKVFYGVLQEYARSGLLNRMFLFSNKEILKIIGNQSISEMHNLINKQIVNAMETIWYFQSQDPVLGRLHEPKEISRICTVSMGNMKKSEEKMLFLLDNCTETCYIYSISKHQIENNKELLKLIKSRVFDEDNKIITSFAIYPSTHKQSFFYSLKFTHYIQPMEIK